MYFYPTVLFVKIIHPFVYGIFDSNLTCKNVKAIGPGAGFDSTMPVGKIRPGAKPDKSASIIKDKFQPIP
jgi:hypothetical protein